MSEDGHDHGYEPTDGSHQHSRWPELPEEFGETTDSLGKSGVYVYVRGELLVATRTDGKRRPTFGGCTRPFNGPRRTLPRSRSSRRR